MRELIFGTVVFVCAFLGAIAARAQPVQVQCWPYQIAAKAFLEQHGELAAHTWNVKERSGQTVRGVLTLNPKTGAFTVFAEARGVWCKMFEGTKFTSPDADLLSKWYVDKPKPKGKGVGPEQEG